MGSQTKLRRSVIELEKTSRVLMSDLNASLLQLERLQPSSGEPASQEFVFAMRTSVRTLFALMEGTSYFMRSSAAKPSNARALGLTEKQRAKLLELRYDSDSNTIEDRLQANPVATNLKLGFRYYTQLFGAVFTLDTGGDSWQVFLKAMVPARNEMTHESQLEDFYCLEAVQSFNATKAWFIRSLADLFQACCLAVGIEVEHGIGTLAKRDQVKLGDIQSPDLSREDFRALVAQDKGRSIHYLLQTFLRLQATELNRSFDLVKPVAFGETQGDPADDALQMRDFYRTVGAYVEGAAVSLRMYLEFAAERGEMSLSDEEVSALGQKDPVARLCATVNIFSLRHGTGGEVDLESPSWQAVARMMKIRDRLTHPKSPKDLVVSPQKLSSALSEVLHWNLEILSVVKLDQGKLNASS